jgi:protein-disulfide isomerase
MPRGLNLRHRDLLLNCVVGVMSLAALGVASVRVYDRWFVTDGTEGPRATQVRNWHDFAVGGERIGSPQAAVTVTVFSDYQCPFCRAAAIDLREIRDSHPQQVTLIFRQHPLSFHSDAYAAAAAALCAAREGSFENFHNALFEQQDSVGRKSWLAFAHSAGIRDSTNFRKCLGTNESVASEIRADSIAGAALGVTGTPVILVNDMRFDGYPGRAELDRYIARAIKTAE